jgi:hypothetical protein
MRAYKHVFSTVGLENEWSLETKKERKNEQAKERNKKEKNKHKIISQWICKM